MIRTLEIVETAQTDKVAVAFVRYSIGAHIYRDVASLRKIDGEWRLQFFRHFNGSSDDPFGDGKGDRAKAIIKRADEWRESNKEEWYESDQ
jgi:hypothetical protein